MRGMTTSVKVVPRGEYTLTLKAQGGLVDGSLEELREELYLTRKTTQHIIDCLWKLGELPTLNQVHQLFYKLLRNQGFRAHQAKQIYKYALSITKSAKRNGGRKPLLKKLSVRLDKYDAKVDLENQLVIVKLRSREFKIKLLHNRNHIEKFLGRKWYEVMLSIDKQRRISVNIPFRWEYKPYKPRKAISLDINLKKIVIYDGRKIRRIDTWFVKAFSLKVHAERIQKKYPGMWRYNGRILDRIRSLHRRSRNIIVDWSRKFAKYIVLKAKKAKSAIALENLDKLWFNASKKSSSLADKLSRFAYRRLQLAIITKAIEYNVPIDFVNPRGTSSTCPRCGAKLSYIHRLAVCKKCKFKADRDTIGALNIYICSLRRMWGSVGSLPNALAMKDEARQSGRTKDEPMTLYIKSYTSI